MTAWGQETAKRPSEMIRFKKGEHPRIWITKADLPGIRARCAAGGTHEREFKRLKELVDLEMTKGEPGEEWNSRTATFVDPVPAAFVYLVTGERKYAERTKKMLKVCPRGWIEGESGGGGAGLDHGEERPGPGRRGNRSRRRSWRSLWRR